MITNFQLAKSSPQERELERGRYYYYGLLPMLGSCIRCPFWYRFLSICAGTISSYVGLIITGGADISGPNPITLISHLNLILLSHPSLLLSSAFEWLQFRYQCLLYSIFCISQIFVDLFTWVFSALASLTKLQRKDWVGSRSWKRSSLAVAWR